MASSSRSGFKRAGLEDEYTPENIRELLKCQQDPIYFIKNYVYIQHPTRGKILFDLFPYQEEFVKQLHTNNRVIAMMSRQMGKCVDGESEITIIKKPSLFKMMVLWFVDRGMYYKIKTI